MTNATSQPAVDDSLGSLIHDARTKAGFTFRALSEISGVAQGQISKIEKDQVLKVNPAHIAALAEPLGLSLYEMYAAAGYKTPESISRLAGDLEDKIRQLPPEAIARLERYVETLLNDTGTASAPGSTFASEPATSN
ncbi:helix-turn-helix transcriptional regulator [Nocardia farcinica]|nr:MULTISPECIES: helix-turn-helix domain-containing protein [Mycobacteriales]MBF6421111.1 helix-turn-helix transcriptional regulator [Nocardia farcinica]MBF6432768.1 helix-turn-helix transcriptional regulator [Nocardia farcinica]MBF6503318.1 helix-turn-helix transcriptional regulator [Nocardia farcinica]SHY17153.1 putative transcriptional regulator [Mycobacteroides abscessus subsp. abscessus]